MARAAGLAELELSALSQLTAVVGMRSMYGASAIDCWSAPSSLARGLGRELGGRGFLYSRWAAHVQGIELDRSGPLARRLLEQGDAVRRSDRPRVRSAGLGHRSVGHRQHRRGVPISEPSPSGTCSARLARHERTRSDVI